MQVEIPLADSLEDAEAVTRQQRDRQVAMVGHTRRFNPSHQWVHRRIVAGEFDVHQMDVQTYFFRRTQHRTRWDSRDRGPTTCSGTTPRIRSTSSRGRRARSSRSHALQGPIHPELGIAMDMSIQLRPDAATICTLSLSFNNDGPLGTFFRYIGDTGTYIARYDDLVDGKDAKIDVSRVDVSMNGIELQDREFVAAIREGREPKAASRRCSPCYRVLARLEAQLASERN